MLYLIEILHQTTTLRFREAYQLCCILSKFYIKPQPSWFCRRVFRVVSYRNSTSNHNKIDIGIKLLAVVSYRNSTSNHNFCGDRLVLQLVVSYRNSTSNHNLANSGFDASRLYLIEILHQTTTSLVLA